MPDVLATQVSLETSASDSAGLIETMQSINVLSHASASMVVTQAAVNILAPSIEWMAAPPVHTTQETAEILSQGALGYWITQCFAEVLGTSDEFISAPDMIETQQQVETLSGETAGMSSTQICVEFLAKAPREQFLYLDSCQRLATGDLAYAYTVSGSVDVSTTYRRARQTQTYRLAEDAFLSRPVPNGGLTAFIGAAVRLGNYPSGDNPILQFMDGSEEVVGLYLDTNGRPKIKTGGHQYAIGTSPVSTTRFQYLELEVLLDNSVGLVRAWIDGDKVCEALNQDTLRTTHAYTDSARWVGAAASFTYITSAYLLSYASMAPSALPLGNIEIHPYKPVSDFSNDGWAPNAGVSLHNAIDEKSPDSSDYIFPSGDGDQYALQHQAFSYPNTSGDNRVLGVQVAYLAKNISESAQTFASVVKKGTLVQKGYADFSVDAGSDWQFFEEGYAVDGSPWNLQGLNVNSLYWGAEQ